jgi:glycerol kinase
MEADLGQPLALLSADGGASGNAFLMQLQADAIGRRVQVSTVEEVGALGAAAMAAQAMGAPDRAVPGGQTFQPLAPLSREAWERTLRCAKLS